MLVYACCILMNNLKTKNEQKQADCRGVLKLGNVIHKKAILLGYFFPSSLLILRECSSLSQNCQNIITRDKNVMYMFFMDAITKHHKLDDLKQQKFVSVLETKNPKSRCLQVHVSSETCRGESFLASSSFQTFLGLQIHHSIFCLCNHMAISSL